jgi:hypothetical protein
MQGWRVLNPLSALHHLDARPDFLEIVLKNRAVTESALTVTPANQTTR